MLPMCKLKERLLAIWNKTDQTLLHNLEVYVNLSRHWDFCKFTFNPTIAVKHPMNTDNFSIIKNYNWKSHWLYKTYSLQPYCGPMQILEQTGFTVSRSIGCKCRGMADIVNYLSNIQVPLLPKFAAGCGGGGWNSKLLSWLPGVVLAMEIVFSNIVFPNVYFLAYFFPFLHSFLLPGTKKQTNLTQKETIFSVKTSAKEKGVIRQSGTVLPSLNYLCLDLFH